MDGILFIYFILCSFYREVTGSDGHYRKEGGCSVPEGATERAQVKVPQIVSVAEKERDCSKGL